MLARVLSLACLLALTGCSSAPDGAAATAAPLPIALQAGDRVTIEYRGGGAPLALCNSVAAAWQPAEAVKIASDDDLYRLLQAWHALAFFDVAREQAPSDARAVLSLRVNDRTWVRARLHHGPAAEAVQFNDCLEVFRYVYDNTLAFRTATDVRRTDLEAEGRRLDQESAFRGRGKQ